MTSQHKSAESTGITTSVGWRVQHTPPETPTFGPDDDAKLDTMAPALFHDYLRVLHPFDATTTLSEGGDSLKMAACLKPGDLVLVHTVHENGWADGTVLNTGERGWLPTNFCEPYDHPYTRNY